RELRGALLRRARCHDRPGAFAAPRLRQEPVRHRAEGDGLGGRAHGLRFRRQDHRAGAQPGARAAGPGRRAQERAAEPALSHHSVPAMPAISTTLPQRTISDLTKAFISSTDGLASGTRLSLAICSLASAVASTAFIASCSFATIAGGVFAGATTMNQPATSN